MARPFQDQFLPLHDSSDSTRDGWHASTEGMMHYLERTRRLMDENVRDCLVTGHQALIDGLILPDANDRHVLAAAIQGNADVIVTFNLRHFPEEALAPYQIEAIHPDDFLLCQIDLSISIVCGA